MRQFRYDYGKLKKRAAFPFETIATAIAFSPRLEALLHETKRITDVFGSKIVLIHIGEKNSTKEDILDDLLIKTGLDKSKCRIIWMQGDPTDLILKICKLNIVDLLILGALEKENLFRYYLGSIARTISRRAKCSVLLMPNASVDSKPFRKIVVRGVDNPKTIHTLKTVGYIASHEHASEITIIQETGTTAGTENTNGSGIKKEMAQDESHKLESFLAEIESGTTPVKLETINGKPGRAIGDYARKRNADLLVFNSPDAQLGLLDRIFAHDIEYVLADIPCNLLIVHSRV